MTNTQRIRDEFANAINSLPSAAKNKIGPVSEKKDTIKFKSWKKSIIGALTFLDNDYDLGIPGDDKNKQIYKDDLINLIGECPNYVCASKILKKTFKNKEILDNIMDKAYEIYRTKGKGKKKKDESTTASASGQYAGPLFGGKPKYTSNVKIDISEIEKIVKETMMGLGSDESTTTASVGGVYVQPRIWASDRENWRGKNKLWKGGKFVSVKEKCKKYPYCNQSPEAIVLSDIPMDKLDHIFEKLSKKINKPYSHIKRVFFKHFDIK